MLQQLIQTIAAIPDAAIIFFGLFVLTLAVLVLWMTAYRALNRARVQRGEISKLQQKIDELTRPPARRHDIPSESLAAAVYHRVNTVYYQRQLKELTHVFGLHGYAIRPAGAANALAFNDLPIATRESIARDFGLARTRLLEPHTEADADLMLRVERDTKNGFFEQLIAEYCNAMLVTGEGLSLYSVDPVRHDYDISVEKYSQRLLDSLVLQDEPEGEPLAMPNGF